MMMPRRRAIVFGASISGLLAARALSSHFAEVLLLERAELPAGPEHRSTVPQGRHAHGLLAGGIEAIERLLPGLVAELLSQGCPSGDNLHDLSWIFGGARLAVGESGVRGLTLARPVLEHAIRARVLSLPGVRLRTGTRVSGLVVRDGRITGARAIAPDSGEETVNADVIVDATGRGSRLPELLQQAGYAPPRLEEVALETNYVSRSYARTEAHAACGVGVLLVSSPQVPRGGLALALDARTWIVSQYALGSVRPPLDPAGYLDFARSLAGPQLARLLETSRPLDEPATMKFAASRRLHYEQLRRLPEGLFVCGDALASFNPTFGQGITVAALQAEQLAALGARVAEPGANRRFLRRASAIVDGAWNTAAGRSFQYQGVRGRPTFAMRVANAYLSRVVARAHSDLSIARAGSRAEFPRATGEPAFARDSGKGPVFTRPAASLNMHGMLRLVQAPPVHYAASARGQIAYQELGEGPAVVIVPPLAQHLEMMWEQPAFWRPLQRLASGFHLVLFDKLGTGLSDPAPSPSSRDDRVDELRAVLDATGLERAWLLGLSEGGIIALTAATGALAECVEGLLLVSTYSGNGALSRASAYGPVPERAHYRAFFDEVVARWGTDETVILRDFAPSLVSIPSMLRWVPRYERAAASPAMIGSLMKSGFGLDATELLPRVKQRALVLHLRGDRVIPASFAKMLAALIPNARYVEFDGDDHFSWISPRVDELIDQLFAFVGTRGDGQRVQTVWSPWSALTPSERRVVGLVQRGLSNAQIAGTLSISPRTVENHLNRAYSKLGVRTRTELALLAWV
jgi:pimeloyl-ACP methyl ester carboxylesterase/DNA-binding CsgD family transcriptional regulator/2-polyprenyl-6-methoxyphenol hydroxylase-like FAD-dependent oxidoreductase